MIQFDGPWHRKYLRGQLYWFLSWLVLTSLSILIRPSVHGHGTHQQLGLPPCTSVVLFNRKCSGCGLTTSWAHTVRGHLVEAFASNAFGTLLYALFTLTAVIGMIAFVRSHRAYYEGKLYNRLMLTLITSFLMYGLWRFCTEPTVAYPEHIVWAPLFGKG